MDTDRFNRLRDGEPQALAALFEEFGGKIYKSAQLFADSREEAEDLVQETFVRAFKSIRRFQGRSSLYTWLYRILLNVTHDLRRKKYIQQKFLSKYGVEEYNDPITDLMTDMRSRGDGACNCVIGGPEFVMIKMNTFVSYIATKKGLLQELCKITRIIPIDPDLF